MVLFGFGVVAFTVHYLVLRGFYALERNRTVFWVQCVIAGTNIALAILLTRLVDPWDTAPMLVLAYTCAYAVGGALSSIVLVRLLRRGGHPASGGAREWRGYLLRLLAAALVVYAVARLVLIVVGDSIAESHRLARLGVGRGRGGGRLRRRRRCPARRGEGLPDPRGESRSSARSSPG
ncbi:lipid II flippase MurJ [Nocardioides convexus]|uniref:lipid II flippase MurJ n=1 Tax=Nocardioides convexus TaxID=2712224 RepID=UPI00241838A1|nr:lipid II flippase MurJ [Nocardioides convexus]